ncbi:hypothetical protein IMY05_008G0102500 [Salix suchowensis]|nr:hypothetical protein IMY05_008G0102500 [Salix suchowensis]
MFGEGGAGFTCRRITLGQPKKVTIGRKLRCFIEVSPTLFLLSLIFPIIFWSLHSSQEIDHRKLVSALKTIAEKKY